MLYCGDAIKILQMPRETFWNLIGTANSRAEEVNSLNPGELPGYFVYEHPGREARACPEADPHSSGMLLAMTV